MTCRSGLPLFIALFLAVCVLGNPRFASADAASDIQSQIDLNQQQVAALEAEIAAFQKQLDALGSKKNTLQSAISSLTLSQQQLAAQIKVTQSKIASANLQIQQLTLSIGDKESFIVADQKVIADQLRSVAISEQTSPVEVFMSSTSLGDAWRTADQASQLSNALRANIADLRTARTELATNRDQVTKAKANLLALQNNLTLQKRSVDASKAAQQRLLSDTKNQESTYQKIIAQKKAAEKAFEKELADLQSQLDIVVHTNLLPKAGSGVLSWPFSAAFMLNCTQRKSTFKNPFCVSQYFGSTSFATANPQVYNGGGHNGIDVFAPIGTPLYASLGGTVLATGNTDLVHDSAGHQCYSFGKWVMIIHDNGLNTLYAHLSSFDVSAGQKVSTGQLIGLSGMTGYATGPHLHYGVYATEGTKIMTLRQFRGATTGCADATMPVATLKAYLNPLSYL